jgi:hypothetical protein
MQPSPLQHVSRILEWVRTQPPVRAVERHDEAAGRFLQTLGNLSVLRRAFLEEATRWRETPFVATPKTCDEHAKHLEEWAAVLEREIEMLDSALTALTEPDDVSLWQRGRGPDLPAVADITAVATAVRAEPSDARKGELREQGIAMFRRLAPPLRGPGSLPFAERFNVPALVQAHADLVALITEAEGTGQPIPLTILDAALAAIGIERLGNNALCEDMTASDLAYCLLGEAIGRDWRTVQQGIAAHHREMAEG